MSEKDQQSSLEALVAAAHNGDPVAAERLWGAAQLRLTKIALALGVPPDEAPDMIQEVLLSAWKNFEHFDARNGSFISWLVPGLRGRARNRVRAIERRDRFFSRIQILRPWQARAQGAQEAVEARATLEKLLGRLTEKQREVVALYEIEGLDSEETGRALGISEAGVRSLARNARRRLQEEARRLHRQRLHDEQKEEDV